jgi:hypothetical protein
MPQEVRMWRILDGRNLKEIKTGKLDLEERIEDWLEQDISIVSDDLLVIGRQVETDFGGIIDLLCLERDGDLVILELKRQKTPREITAQVLDYASWVKDLPNEKITDIANNYLGDRAPLGEAFGNQFGVELPEILNEHHKMLIVASEIDDSTERIIKYLSDSYGVSINATTFEYFRDEDGSEFLSKVFLIEPSQVAYRSHTRASSKRRPYLTYEQLEEIADKNGVGELYKRLYDGLKNYFDYAGTTTSTAAFIGIIEGSRNTIFSLAPSESDTSKGLHFQVYIDRFTDYLGTDKHNLLRILPSELTDYKPWKNAPPMLSGFFSNINEIERFLSGVGELKRK